MADEAFEEQLQALEDVMSARRYEMTTFEADAWMRIIQAVPRANFLAFLSHHYATSPYAPQPSDATKHLDLSINPDVAFNRLAALVGSVGPYSVPQLDDPILVTAIQLLGGWSAVNEQLPDVSQTHAMRAYRERFDACFNTAITKVRIEGAKPSGGLKAIGSTGGAALGHQSSEPATAPISITNQQRPRS